MADVLTPAFLTVVITTGIAAGVPLLFASLGEIVAEQGGVLNVGLEGMMLAGAFAGFIVALDTGDPWLGLLGGGIVGAAVSLIMVVYCIRLGMDQIVVGIGIVLVAEGATSILHKAWFARSYPSVPQGGRASPSRASRTSRSSGPRSSRCRGRSTPGIVLVASSPGSCAGHGSAWRSARRASARTRWTPPA